MISRFADTTTADIFHGRDSKAARKVPKEIWALASRKMDAINAASVIGDLRIPPGNRLEKLKGNLAGHYSIRVNQQYRIVFKFENGVTDDVKLCDYHD